MKLACLSIQWVIVKVHPAGDGDPDSELVGDCLVLVDPDAGHLLEHSLSAERVQAVDLELWIPNILENLRRLVDLLTQDSEHW